MVSTDWGATNKVKNDVLKKFIRDNYDLGKSHAEITRIINDGQDPDDAYNHDDDERIMMEVLDNADLGPRDISDIE